MCLRCLRQPPEPAPHSETRRRSAVASAGECLEHKSRCHGRSSAGLVTEANVCAVSSLIAVADDFYAVGNTIDRPIARFDLDDEPGRVDLQASDP